MLEARSITSGPNSLRISTNRYVKGPSFVPSGSSAGYGLLMTDELRIRPKAYGSSSDIEYDALWLPS